MELARHRAIITGANRGLGVSIAIAFVEAGANVLLTARDAELLERVATEIRKRAKRPDQQIETLPGDVADEKFAPAAASRFRSLKGEISVLVNNAGVLGPTGLLEESDWTGWMDTIRINLFGTALMSRAILPMLRESGYGKIINL